MSGAAVSPSYVRTMAAYNDGMNGRLYAAADRLSEAERRRDRGAFFGSIHRTLCHILWADGMWMSRFEQTEAWPAKLPQSADMIQGWDDLGAARTAMDARIRAWADEVDEAWLAADQTWFSGAAQREFTMPRGFLVMHLFNHQTHHRGQAHALITAAGETTGDTDLFLVTPPLD